MLNIIYCSIFVISLWLPFVILHCHWYGLSFLQVFISLFNAINCLICTWEISLYHNIEWIQRHHQSLQERFGAKKLPPGFVLLDHAPSLSSVLTLSHWAQIWSTYALLDPSYADSNSFGFWIDVGNGHFFLLPSLLLSICMTFDISIGSPRFIAVICIIANYVMMHGTFLYFASYLFHRRYHGCSMGSKFTVAFANGLWIIFPSLAIYILYQVIDTNRWDIVRHGNLKRYADNF